MSKLEQCDDNERMDWLIVEDGAGQIINWLAVLRTKGIRGATALSEVGWNPLLEHSKQTYSTKPPQHYPALPSDCQHLETNKRLFGVRSGRVIVLFVMTKAAGSDVAHWLQARLPNECLSFLDYELAGDTEAKLAELVAPHLARSFSQICVNHSSRIGETSASPELGLASDCLPFYKSLTKRLTKPEAATACVFEALEFWESLNDRFTTDRDVDKVIGLFARGKACNWDPPLGPFHHDTLQNPRSITHRQIKAIGLIPEEANDNLKGLFQCNPGVRRASGKMVRVEDLKRALQVIGFTTMRLEIPERWSPPFLPGILFLCHLKLMHAAFSKSKIGEDRVPPVLTIGTKSAKFEFTVEIEKQMGSWEITGSNSFRLMQAANKGIVGEKSALWLSTTAAKAIVELLQPTEVTPLTVQPRGKTVHIEWS